LFFLVRKKIDGPTNSSKIMNKKGADCSLILSKAGYFSEQNSMVKFKPEAYGSRILEESQKKFRMLSDQNSFGADNFSYVLVA
jgi:hypothetical protein